MAETISIKEVQERLKSGQSPHVRKKRESRDVMTDVLIALIPPVIAAAYFFGWWVFVQLAVAIGVAALSEYLWQKWTNQRITLHDRSVYVTGLLMGLSFPVTAPLWVVALGSIIAVVVVKQWNFGMSRGGLGRNYLNPALTSRVIMKAFFTPFFANWILPGGFFSGPYGGYPDAVTVATPLEYIGHGATTVAQEVPEIWELFLGLNLGGNIGETSKLAILIGMLYLIFRRVINPKIPILFILSGMLVAGLWADFNLEFMLAHAFSGTMFFAATYMATDYSSGALTPGGKTVFAILGGILTVLIRLTIGWPGGVGFAIIAMNLLAPHLDRKLAPKIYGHKSRPNVKFDRQKSSPQ